MFAHDLDALQLMKLLDDKFIKPRHFVGSDLVHGEVFQDALLIGHLLAMPDGFWFHARQRKKSDLVCLS